MAKPLSRDTIFSLVILIATALLLLLPTGFPTHIVPGSDRRPARVLEVDNDGVQFTSALVYQGQQLCTVEILSGPLRGKVTTAINRFTGRMELDKVFAPGDTALVVVDYAGDQIRHAVMIDHYRLTLQGVLLGAFALLLLAYAGWTGARALLSFLFTVLILWKVLVPLLLKGWDPVGVSLVLVIMLTVVVLLLVGGFNRKSLAAILGSLSGTLLTALMAVMAGHAFRIHGAVLPYSETLLYAGYAHLNLTRILMAVVFVASAGALMDLAMDIASAVHEVVERNPSISAREAIGSGLTIGRNVVGTMTTTLLFAYTGGYIALLMVFMAQGTPTVNILNLKYVSKEIMHTIVGSMGLVMVAPLTALFSGALLTKTRPSRLPFSADPVQRSHPGSDPHGPSWQGEVPLSSLIWGWSMPGELEEMFAGVHEGIVLPHSDAGG